MDKARIKALLYRLAPLMVLALVVMPKSWRW